MAFRTKGVVRITADGDANFGLTTATTFDGKVSDKAITEQTDGTSSDVSDADELLIYDTNGSQLLRVTVNEIISGAGIATVGFITGTGSISVGASLIPTENITFDLGSASNRFRDLYLEGTTIYLGDATISIVGGNLVYEGEQVITGAGGTINSDYADITDVNAGVLTATQVGAANSGVLLVDGDYVPTHNRTFELGQPLKSWNKIFIKNGPKAIEFENTDHGIGISTQGFLTFDEHEVFFGDGSIGARGNLANVYASGIVSATAGAVIGGITTITDHLIVDDSNNLGTEYNFNVKTSGSSTFGVLGNGSVLLGNSSASPFIASNDHHATSKKYVDDAISNSTPTTVTLSGGPTWTSGVGDPNGVVAGAIGSLYSRIDGAPGTALYVKESGLPSSNTGWSPK